MKIGICHNIFGTDLPAAFAGAAHAGAEGVEVVVQNDLARRLGREELAKQLNALRRQHKLEIPSLAMVNLCSQPSLIARPELTEAAVQSALRGLKTAAAVEASVLLLPFFGRNLIETETEFGHATDTIARLSEHAEQAAITLGIECTLNASQQLLLLASAGRSPYVRVYFDIGNTLARKYDVATFIRDLGHDSICQVHFKDVRIAEGAPPDYEVTLGQGSVDFRAVLHALRAVRYDGYIVLETPPGPDAPATTRANVQFIRDLLAAGGPA